MRPLWRASQGARASVRMSTVPFHLSANLAADPHAIARADVQQFGRPPHQIVFKFREAPIGIGDLEHHLHDAQPTLLVEGAVQHAGEGIKINGFRISPTEIEDVTKQLAFVDDVVAVCVKSDDKAETIHLAVAVRNDAEPPAEDEITKFLRSRVANYMVPAKVHYWTESFPRTANGKTDYGTIQRLLNALDAEPLKKTA